MEVTVYLILFQDFQLIMLVVEGVVIALLLVEVMEVLEVEVKEESLLLIKEHQEYHIPEQVVVEVVLVVLKVQLGVLV
jgi:hypothetical protein